MVENEKDILKAHHDIEEFSKLVEILNFIMQEIIG